MDDLRFFCALSLIPKCSDEMLCNYGAPVPGNVSRLLAGAAPLPTVDAGGKPTKVAVIGGGIAGCSCAFSLTEWGHLDLQPK